MKKKNDIFQKNIEKLMKLNDKNDQPNEAFVDKLIEGAMVQLTTPQENIKLKERAFAIKLTFKRTAAIAAALIVITGIFAIIMTQQAKQKDVQTKFRMATRDENQNSELKVELIPLQLDLPDAILGGTPIPRPRLDNLEMPSGTPRPPFMVPKGTVNIAAGKAVTCPDIHITADELAKITDGDKAGTDGGWVELGLYEQHVTIDLGAKHNIYAIVVWHYFKEARVYLDVVVQVSDDPDFINNVVTLFNNDLTDNFGFGSGKDKLYIETTQGKLIDAKGMQARYVRMYSNANSINDLNHYVEIEVYGKPIDSEKSKAAKVQADKQQLAPIKLKLPKPILGGTPVNLNLSFSKSARYSPMERGLPQMVHGGTTVPNGEAYDAMFFKNYGVNPFIDTEDDHLSTFATDVDTGSYTLTRTYLQRGNIPPNEAVRVEEFVNYFNYDYSAPAGETFAVYAEACPWQLSPNRKNTYLLRIGLKGAEISDENRKPANLTFVIDVSGSMGRENRLGLVKKSLRMLVDELKESDTIGIAVYGSRGRIVLDHTGIEQKSKIISAIESLRTNGSTNAEEGIRIGYDMADKVFEKGMINRVILCSDGVANVGRTGHEEIFKQIKDKADKGITLSALGFGMGNYNDVMMERLGNKGNGHYSYIDNLAEARRLFVENLTGTLQVIARDVKLQVDFNPYVVRSYRLIGYENRDVADEKFRDDKEDGGEMGAGHSTTALYELKLWPGKEGKVATTYIRYKDPESVEVTEFNSTFSTADIKDSFTDVSRGFALAATVTEFAEILRKSHWAKDAKLEATLEKAQLLLPEFKGNADVIELTDLIAKAAKYKNTNKENNE